MKKFLFVLSMLLFTVVMFASPPPNYGPDIVTGQSAYVVQENAVISIPVTIEVQEVAFNYIGNAEKVNLPECTIEPNMESGLAVSGMNEIYATADLVESNKPPGYTELVMGAIVKNRSGFQRNLQNTNYGYPFTADRC
jgi:hypothetical protein